MSDPHPWVPPEPFAVLDDMIALYTFPKGLSADGIVMFLRRIAKPCSHNCVVTQEVAEMLFLTEKP